MKKYFLSLSFVLVAFTATADGIMTKKSDKTYVINTTELCNVRGFKGSTPLEVHILKDKIVKIVPLKNSETPRYYKKVEDAVNAQFIGKKVTKLEKVEIDGVTGATFTAKAVKENLSAAIKYYKKNK